MTILAQDDFVPVYGTGPLLLIAVAAVALLLVLIMVLRLHAFVALILVSLLTALVAGIPVADAVPALLEGFGTTLASVVPNPSSNAGTASATGIPATSAVSRLTRISATNACSRSTMISTSSRATAATAISSSGPVP